jgi:hypothetical protein
MSSGKTEEFELDDAYDDGVEESDEATKAAAIKNTLLKRRVIDEILEERRVLSRIKDYDFDLDDEE